MSSSSSNHPALPPTAAAVNAAFDPSSTSASNSRTTSAGIAAGVDHRDAASGRLPAAAPTSASPLAGIKVKLRAGLRQFPDFPSPGILFEDIMPLFANPSLHADLITALELQVQDSFGASGAAPIDVVVGLESRGFLFGPTLAARIGAGFVPVRKQGKLPGPCETATYTKEYGSDNFQMQADAIKAGQRVLIVDDIIATGGSAAAAGSLVRKLGGDLAGYLFLMELDFLKGRAKLDAPVFTLLTGQEEGLAK